MRRIVAALALAVMAGPGWAEQCADRAAVVAALATKYGETRRGIGMASNNTMMELFVSDAGSWTITVTRPDGVSCLVASGEAFETLAESLPPEGDPG